MRDNFSDGDVLSGSSRRRGGDTESTSGSIVQSFRKPPVITSEVGEYTVDLPMALEKLQTKGPTRY